MARKKVVTASDTNEDVVVTRGERKGAVLAGADYLLSRLPWFKYRYEGWSKTKRIIVGYLMWLIVLPVIPLAIMAVMYVRDPEGFKKSPWFAILSIITVAWFGAGLGYVNSQSPYETADGKVTKGSQAHVRDLSQSEPTEGRKFINCTDAFNHRVFDIPRGDASYEARLDRDSDGLACER